MLLALFRDLQIFGDDYSQISFLLISYCCWFFFFLVEYQSGCFALWGCVCALSSFRIQ